uniref:Uncharacterized protein n=1 Tax=Arcella intermedia TaxID=1963864 RepID=A0A6B2L7B0_9EUKA
MVIVNKRNKLVTNPGSFQLYSIGHLLTNFNEREPTTRRVKFVVLSRSDSESLKYVDVNYLQSQESNKGALFQVASNFNCVEGIGGPPDEKDFVTNYIYDKTQGPYASISCGGAAILRVFGAFAHPNQHQVLWRQTKDKQINLLSDLSSYFPIQHGYVALDRDNDVKLPEDKETLLSQFQIGYQQNAQVIFGEAEGEYFKIVPPEQNQTIDQIFVAALNLAQGLSGRLASKIPGVEHKAQFLLKGAYDGTYLAALYHNKKKIFLTSVGGGVFGNREDWIVDAMLDAHEKYGHSLEKVYFVQYNKVNGESYLIQQLKRREIPFKWVSYTNTNKQVLFKSNNK